MRTPVCLIACVLYFLTKQAFAVERSVTFNKDVAPILFSNCSICHRPGEAAPFSLLTYADASKRARQIAQITATGEMPPWKPVAGHGDFLYARTLAPQEIGILRKWADAGVPRGEPGDLPAMPTFPAGWHLGTPDLILQVDKPFKVPAEGNDLYVHFVLPTGLTKDRYFRAVQVLPSNRRVAHHGVPILDAAGGTASKLARANGGYYVQFGGPGFLPRGFLPGYAPGMITHELPEDQPGVLAKGLDVVLQMHYHPTGKPEIDQPRVGIYFTDRKPARNGSAILMANNDIDIPPGEARYTRTDEFRLPVDYEFRSIFAHMHMIGRDFHVWAELPDGSSRELLLIDDWDYRWQDTYFYARPFVLPHGTIVKARFVWDNTADNPRNPHDPPQRIRWGEGSTDEMSGVIIGGMPVRQADEGWHWLAVLAHYLDRDAKDKQAKQKWDSAK